MFDNINSYYDICIIGAGISGCTAAIYAVTAGKSTILCAGHMPGGLITTTHRVDNYTCLPGISGIDMGNSMIEHAKQYATYINESVVNITHNSITNIKEVILSNNKKFTCKVILICTGSSPTKLNITGELVQGVSYCAVCDGYMFKGQDVSVVGGGNAALEEVIYLSSFCRTVYLIHRRDTFRAYKTIVDKVYKLVETDKVKLILNTIVSECIQNNNTLDKLVLENTTGAITTLDVKGFFIAIGHTPNSDFIKLPIKSENGYILVDNNFETQISGIYAAGDIIQFIDPVRIRHRQAIISGGEASNAILNAISKYLQ